MLIICHICMNDIIIIVITDEFSKAMIVMNIVNYSQISVTGITPYEFTMVVICSDNL